MIGSVKRRTAEVRCAGITWKLQSVVPVDLIHTEHWPFHAFEIVEPKGKQDNIPDYFKKDPLARMYEGKEGLKPGGYVSEAEKQETALLALMEKAIVSPVVSSKTLLSEYEYKKLQEDEELFNILFEKIFQLTYDLTDEDRFNGTYPIKINRDFARQIYYQAHQCSLEPWVLLEEGTISPPALMNPKRWDFNQAIWLVGMELQAEIQDKAKGEAVNNGEHRQESNPLVHPKR
jgi:hypothetical protein